MGSIFKLDFHHPSAGLTTLYPRGAAPDAHSWVSVDRVEQPSMA